MSNDEFPGDDTIAAAMDTLLESPYWLSSLDTGQIYRRMEDDTAGLMTVCFGQDGDGWIAIVAQPDPNEVGHPSYRFRMPFFGGGESPRVRNALLVLAEAIRRDNADHPQTHRIR